MGSHLCGAKTRSGGKCKLAPMPNGRCRMHGGMTPLGPAHGAYKHGRYSKLLPARLAARYEEALADDTLLELRSDVALLDVRISEALQRANAGEGGQLWPQLKDALRNFLKGLTKRDSEGMRAPLQAMEHLIERGAEETALWDEIVRLLEQRRKLVESERKRLVEMQQIITTEQAMTLLAVILDTIRRHVADRKALGAIGADLARLVASTAGDATQRSGGG